MDMDKEGQRAAHIPHPLQEADIVSAFFFLPTFVIFMAEYGQSPTQIPHPIQVAVSTDDTMGSTIT
jgi:hypothetical protein